MGRLDVCLGQGEIFAHHVHRRVSQHHLQGEGIAAIAQVGDGEGVAEAMRIHIGDAGALADGGDEAPEIVAA